MYPAVASLAAAMMLAGCSVFGVRSGYEEPAYTVIDSIEGDVEIRSYQPRLAAKTVVEANGGSADRNEAFRILFDYISGANQGSAKVAMTVPVEVSSATDIAMTVPVETSATADGRTMMRFFLPSEFSLATAPAPTDPRVQIEEVPETTKAVLRFTGFGNTSHLQQRQAELAEALNGSRWSVAGEPTALFYDPPWTVPFLRRNEIAIPVVGQDERADG